MISSRQPLVELQSNAWLEERYITIDLQTLPIADGAKLLTQLGVKGTRTELERATNDLGGHALALVLLGRMLVKQFAGRIERRDQLPVLWQGESQATRMLRWYGEQYRPRDNTPSRGVIPDAAAHDLQEADSLIRRGGMKLYAVDCQLAWCRYYLARGEKETARKCWKQAKAGMEVMGYGLREREVGALREQI